MLKPTIRWNYETRRWDTTDCKGFTWPMVLWVNALKIIDIDYNNPELRAAARTQNWDKP